MDFFLSLLIAGACVGSVYALVAVGLNLTFWTTKTLNFGQGAVMMLCAVSTALLTAQGLSNGIGIIAGLALVAIVGVIVERARLRWKSPRPAYDAGSIMMARRCASTAVSGASYDRRVERKC